MRAVTIALVSIAAAAGTAGAQAAGPWGTVRGDPSLYSEPISRARTMLIEAMELNRVPGAAVTVMKDGRVVWSEGFGYANLEQKHRATPRTAFPIFGISKPLTGAALGLLVQEGKLDLDAPVQQYVPAFPQQAQPVTARQLAGDLVSSPNYQGTDGFSVASVIEAAGGEPFPSFLRRRVFDPFKMRQTGPDRADSVAPTRTAWYMPSRSGDSVVVAPVVDDNDKWAGARFLSTTEDLALFGSLLLDYRFLNRRTVHLLWSGLGWQTGMDPTGRNVVGHETTATGFLLVYPVERFVFAFLSNSDQPNPLFDEQLRELFLRTIPIR